MNVIKLDATASTNTYLKDLLTSYDLDNFTVVSTENQFAGRGQRGEVWSSEVGSNLTFSVLVRDFLFEVEDVFCLNIIAALAVRSAVKKIFTLELDVKWPNDILSVNRKVGGILIENIFKAEGAITSIVGIGLNVNQVQFTDLIKATSLALLLGSQIDKDALMLKVVEELEMYCQRLQKGEKENLWQEYLDVLYRKGVPSAFELPTGKRFMGIIIGVSMYGFLQVKLEDDSVEEFGVKEIKLLY
ncbi:biotin--[acetyl-CoA-carboxylase] ligase [Myroides albus]|uniref:Biotin--[acetyl-CoA-carboxylase] ligase n=1 Tax=Myroides albus TaxID=2562892 RepID=A0A6I3LN31_9FLAO|nr:biotin--[acetyl-CoA-carboxylase] ligase [Myroides albus]MTG97991.1 biotin--[acetyl-CoA-carboxylase] ligase [Myroides albus]UVD80282.1 biotin--[acetyl-CoA-carboxylase] ligase [Myroides albus]